MKHKKKYKKGDPIEYQSGTDWYPGTFEKHTSHEDSCIIRLEMDNLAYATVSLIRPASELDKNNPNATFKRCAHEKASKRN